MKEEQEIDKKLDNKIQLEENTTKEDIESVNIGKYKFITTKEGALFLNDLKKGLDLIDAKKLRSRQDKVKFNVVIDYLDHKDYIPYETTKEGLDHFKHLLDPHKDERRADRDVVIPQLTFHDGVILTYDIFKKLIKPYIDNDVAWEYMRYIDDLFFDILTNQILNPTVTNRAEELQHLFEIQHSEFKF